MKAGFALSLLGAIAFAVTAVDGQSDPLSWHGNKAYYFEAEEATLTGTFVLNTSEEDAYGNTAVFVPQGTQQQPEDGCQPEATPPDPLDPTNGDRASFELHGIEAGYYHIYARVQGEDECSDSFWVSVDGNEFRRWHFNDVTREWLWLGVEQPSEGLAGPFLLDNDSTITFALRHDGAKLDRILITPARHYRLDWNAAALDPDFERVAPAPNDHTSNVDAEADGAAGDVALWVPDDTFPPGANNPWAAVPPDGDVHQAVFSLNDIEAGEYYMYARVKGPGDDSDSFWVSVDGGITWEDWHFQDLTREWIWLPVQKQVPGSPLRGPYSLEPGDTVRFKVREDGALLDRLHLTNGPALFPDAMARESGDFGIPNWWLKRRVLAGEPAYPFEAEVGEHGSPFRVRAEWQQDESISDPVSEGYFVEVDPEADDATAGPDPLQGELGFELNDLAPGNYYLWARVHGPDDFSDSFYISTDGANWEPWHFQTTGANWTWRTFYVDTTRQVLNVSETDHSLMVRFKHREAGAAIDRVLLTTSESYTPSGLGDLPNYTFGDTIAQPSTAGGPDDDNLAVALIGQVKNFAVQAYYEMEEKFAGIGGADDPEDPLGSPIADLVHPWIQTPAHPDNTAAIRIDQLKNVASRFHRRLEQLDLPAITDFPPHADDDAVATLGQVKHLLNFDIPSISWPVQREDPWPVDPPSSWLTTHGVTATERNNALMAYQHWQIGTDDPRMEGPIHFERFDGADQTFHAIYTWTSAMEYVLWMQRWVEQSDGGMAEELGADGIPNYFKYALYWHPTREWPDSTDDPLPVIQTSGNDHTISFVRRTNEWLASTPFSPPLEPRRVSWWVEEDVSGDGDWEWIEHQEDAPDTSGLEDGLERVNWTASTANKVRVVMRVEPRPVIFAHHMGSLNVGIGAMHFHASPYPSYTNLFDQSRDARNGGQYRDFPLAPPGLFIPGFDSAPPELVNPDNPNDSNYGPRYVASADLQIRRALRAGIDGFAINMWSGISAGKNPGMHMMHALFEAAARIRENGGETFYISVCPDPATIGEDDVDLAELTADGLEYWLGLADDPRYAPHIKTRAGDPIIFGWLSFFYWRDFFSMIMAAEWESLTWDADIWGPQPTDPIPANIKQIYDGAIAEGKTPRDARHDAAVEWAKDPDTWRWMRRGFDAVEGFLAKDHNREVRLFWQYEFTFMTGAITHQQVPEASRALGRYFPSMNIFLPQINPQGEDTSYQVRNGAIDGGAEWGEPTFFQYGNYNTPSVQGGPGTVAFEQRWNAATHDHTRSSMIQYTTWNDYHENTHLDPGYATRYVPSFLNNHFATIWKTGSEPEYTREKLFVLHRKYPEVDENQNPVTVFPFEPTGGPVPYHPGNLEVISVLNATSQIVLADRDISPIPEVQAGFQITRFSDAEHGGLRKSGSVNVEIRDLSNQLRTYIPWNGGPSIPFVLTSPEEITHRPFRVDYGLVGYSTEYEYYWSQDVDPKYWSSIPNDPDPDPTSWSTAPIFRYAEYRDSNDDGLPNWFKMLHQAFGFNDFSVWSESAGGQTAAYVAAYQARAFPEVVERETFGNNGQSWALPTSTNATISIQAENFDRGGQFTAYFKSRRLSTAITASQGSLPYRASDIGWTVDGSTVGEYVTVSSGGSGNVVSDNYAGDWLEYTVDSPGGSYEVAVRVNQEPGSMLLRVFNASTGAEVTAAAQEAVFASGSGFRTVWFPASFNLPAGDYRVRLQFEANETSPHLPYSFDSFQVRRN